MFPVGKKGLRFALILMKICFLPNPSLVMPYRLDVLMMMENIIVNFV